MPVETFSKLLLLLASLLGFVCTIWAISVPSIRTHPGSHVWLSRAAWGILFALGALFVLSAMWELIPIDYGIDPPVEKPTIGEVIAGTILLAVLLLTGFGTVWTLDELSEPK